MPVLYCSNDQQISIIHCVLACLSAQVFAQLPYRIAADCMLCMRARARTHE